MTRDNVTVSIDAVIFLHVLDPQKATFFVSDYKEVLVLPHAFPVMRTRISSQLCIREIVCCISGCLRIYYMVCNATVYTVDRDALIPLRIMPLLTIHTGHIFICTVCAPNRYRREQH